MRVLSSFIVTAGLMLATVGSAEAVTYGAITISVPVSVSAPFSEPGTYTVAVTCSSPKTATYSGIAQTVTKAIPVASGIVKFGPAPLQVPVSAGLQSGATVTCAMTFTPPYESSQLYLSNVTYDATKMTSQLVLP